MSIKKHAFILIFLLLVALLALGACGNKDAATGGNDVAAGEEENQGEAEGTDNGSSGDKEVTLADLNQSLKSIQSYYVDYYLPDIADGMTIKIWYKGDKIKTCTSTPGDGDSYTYFDLAADEGYYYTPADGQTALRFSGAADSEEKPDDMSQYSWSDYSIIGYETIDNYDCVILQNLDGEKSWVMKDTGFLVQKEYTDNLTGELGVIKYENIRLNDIEDEEVTLPADVQISDLTY